MKATEAKLLEFLKKAAQFVIPIYQRTYSWGEKECQQLWDDILRAGRNDKVPAHFVGSIVYVEKGLYQVSSQSPLLVIDGQQRLTTVSLLIEALARRLGDTEPLKGFSAKKLRNYYLLNPLEDGEKRYKLILSQTDKASLVAVLDQQPSPKDHSIRVHANFDFFHKMLAATGIGDILVSVGTDRTDRGDRRLFGRSTGRLHPRKPSATISAMPRTARAAVGYCYHVLNRGNERAEVFHDPADFHAFVALLRQACARVAMRLIGFCVMPNHFHCVLWPEGDPDMARWMEWLLTTLVSHYRQRYGGSGHVWQGRYKAFPIAQDDHLPTALRYVERNALRANLVERAEDWPWSSLREWLAPPGLPWLHPGPVPRGPDWLAQVNAAQTEAELARLRRSVGRGIPFGNDVWVRQTAAALGLEFTLRSRGRPPGKGRPAEEEQPGLFS